MSKTHWKKMNNPDYLGAYVLEPGEDLVLTIASAGEETYVGNAGKKETGLLVHFKEKEYKPMICNATNAKTISKVVGSPYIEDWAGEKIQLFASEVNAFGEMVEALRIRPFKPKSEEFFCKDCGARIDKFGKFTAKQVAENTQSKYGRYLCISCANQAKKELEKEILEGDILNENN